MSFECQSPYRAARKARVPAVRNRRSPRAPICTNRSLPDKLSAFNKSLPFPETIVSENGSRQRKRLTGQHLLEYFKQRPGCIRLLQESRQTLPRKPLDGFHLVIAAGQDHRNRRMNRSQFPERGLPA